jgi:retron-type reverse transcriptase
MGAIVARYFKDWDPFWFNFHASVQSLGFILGLIGVISGLILNNQLHVNFNLHKALGIIILVLACLQVFSLGHGSSNSLKMRYFIKEYCYLVRIIKEYCYLVRIIYTRKRRIHKIREFVSVYKC